MYLCDILKEYIIYKNRYQIISLKSNLSTTLKYNFVNFNLMIICIFENYGDETKVRKNGAFLMALKYL